MIATRKSDLPPFSRDDALALRFSTSPEIAGRVRPPELAFSQRNERAMIARLLLPSLGIEPADLAVAFQLADAVAKQQAKFNRVFARCQQDFCETSVHDARVHCRRLIARLTLVQEAVPGSVSHALLRSLKVFLKQLGALRDVQVQKLALTGELTAHPEVAGLWVELGKREVDLTRSAAESMGRFKIVKLTRRMDRLEAELTDPTAHLAAKASLHQRVIQALARAHAMVSERRRAINPAIPSTLHKTRTVFKKFRYMVESLPPAVAQPSRSVLTAMSDYQAAMGKVQDVEVSLGFMEDYSERFPLMAAELAGFQQLLQARRRARIEEFLAVADSLKSFWPLPPELI